MVQSRLDDEFSSPKCFWKMVHSVMLAVASSFTSPLCGNKVDGLQPASSNLIE